MYNFRDSNNLTAAHRMGVSWGQIWTIIGALVVLALLGFGVAILIGRENAKMIDQKINEATTQAESSQNTVQKQIQESVDQKLREAGINPVQK